MSPDGEDIAANADKPTTRIPTIDSSIMNGNGATPGHISNTNSSPDTKIHKTNGHHTKNGTANGTVNIYKNGTSPTDKQTNGSFRRDSASHVWSPLLQKDIQPTDTTDIYSPSNNNEWKESEEINNLRNGMHKSHGNNNGSLMNGKNGIGTEKNPEHDPLTGVKFTDTPTDNDDDDDSVNCGIGSCSPKWARPFASTHCFMVVFLLGWVLQGMFATYFVSVITTIEKLFQIKSKITGTLMSATEIGQICTAMLLTYYAGRGHRPRWIACGMALFAVAAFGCALPHIIFGSNILEINSILKAPNSASSSSGGSGHQTRLINLNNTTPINPEAHLNLCYAIDNFTRFDKNQECEEDFKLEQASKSKLTVVILCIFFVSLLCAGVGQTAVSTLGIPYIDDNVASRESPIYIAITIGVRILGPAGGFIVGSFCARVYVDLSNPGFGPTDPKWVGAWWLGLILIATLMILTSIAMFTFPKHLRGNRIPPPTKERALEEEQQKHQQHEEEARPRLRDFPKTVRRQLSNDILMFRTASSVLHLLPVAGLYTFLPKYLETQFRLSAADANLMTGIYGILVMGLGIIISGYVILKLSPTARSVAAWIAFTALVYSCGMAILMFIGCNMDDFAGLQKYDGIKKFEATCNITCDCDLNKFSPICGADGRTYFSSCQAGCNSSRVEAGKRIFSNCDCIPNVDKEINIDFEATSGYCDGDCKNFVLFISLFAFFVFMHSTSEVGSILLIMRCTDPKDKAMAMGIIQSAIGIFGNVPCPIIYGAVVDSACLVWDTVCGKPGACSLYDIDIFRQFFLGTTSGIMMLAFLMDLVVWYKADRIDIDPSRSPAKNSQSDIQKPAIEIAITDVPVSSV